MPHTARYTRPQYAALRRHRKDYGVLATKRVAHILAPDLEVRHPRAVGGGWIPSLLEARPEGREHWDPTGWRAI